MTAESTSESVDLSSLEPVLHMEDEGLDIKGYEVDGEFLLDFDWAPGSRWSFLDDEVEFKQFVVRWLEEMTGRAIEEEELAQLSVVRTAAGSREDSTEDPESQPAEQAEQG